MVHSNRQKFIKFLWRERCLSLYRKLCLRLELPFIINGKTINKEAPDTFRALSVEYLAWIFRRPHISSGEWGSDGRCGSDAGLWRDTFQLVESRHHSLAWYNRTVFQFVHAFLLRAPGGTCHALAGAASSHSARRTDQWSDLWAYPDLTPPVAILSKNWRMQGMDRSLVTHWISQGIDYSVFSPQNLLSI